MDCLDPLYEAIGWLLAQFYSVIPNLGVSIILLTFTIMLILYPLTAKQAKSMIAMQRVQPEIKKLQAKYKGDRQKLNEEMMKFYKENKINPLGGLSCRSCCSSRSSSRSSGCCATPTSTSRLDSNLYAELCRKSNGVVSKTADACGKGTSVNHLKFLGMDLQQVGHRQPLERAGSRLPYFVLVGARDAHGVPADPPGPEAHAGRQQADGRSS